MRHAFCLFPLLALVAALASAAPPVLTDDAIFAADSSGTRPGDPAWSPDGRRLAYLWNQDEAEAVWVLDVASGRREVLADPRIPIDSFAWSPRGDALLIVSEGDLHLWSVRDRKLRRLTETEAEEKDAEISPDGTRVAFVRDFDLHVLDLATGRERALTTDGEENVFLNGITDWVYWEEIWDRESAGFWWSPDGRRIAYYRFDERDVPEHPLVDEVALAPPSVPEIRWQKFPKPGEKNPRVRVGVIDAAGGETVWMETGEKDSYLARVDWTPAGDAVAIQRLSRDQARLELLRCGVSGGSDGSCSPLVTETWPTWVNLGNDYRFLPDGRFLWGSDRGGWRRLYLYDAAGRLVRPVTPEGWAVTSLDGIVDDGDDGDDGVIFTAFRTEGLGPAERQVLRASLSRDAWEPLTTEPGTHAAEVAPKGGAWVHTWGDSDTPPRDEVRTAAGKTIALPFAPPSGYDPAALPKYEYFFIPGPEGSRLPARMLKPAGFDPSRRYPVIVYHYGGPGSQVVQNRWETRRRDLWHKKMAGRGFAVFSVDNLSSTFFGKQGEDRNHRRFGPVNLDAQLAAVDYLKSLPWVDAGRLGVWGWSGGGYHTLYSLLKRPGVWKAGVAGAPVTEWTLYDSIWTERYLGTPAANPEGYRESSVVKDAANLRDRLLIVHGLADDNVHPQNTVLLMDALVKAGVPFDTAFYPGQTHAFQGDSQRHFFARMTEFFERELLPAR